MPTVHGEKSTKYFLNLEKINHVKMCMRKLKIAISVKQYDQFLTAKLDIPGFLIFIDFRKAFDSLELNVLQKINV